MQSRAAHRRGIAKNASDSHNQHVPQHAQKLGASRRRRETISDPSRIQDLFLTRLEELERRVSSELARPLPENGPIQALAADLLREGWRLGLRGLGSALRPSEALAAAALALAARPSDVFGIDHALSHGVRDLLAPTLRLWLGADDDAVERLPAGAALVTFNRSAWPLPAEPVMLWALLASRLDSQRLVCALWEPGTLELPFVGEWLGRLGVFAATPANARALLERGALVLCFPEGRAAHAKTYERRYRLTRFDDGGLLHAAIDCGASIVPAAVVGNEESYPVVGRFGGWPITPTFPLAGLLGLMPLPMHWSIRLAAPVEYPADAAATTHADGISDAVRARMQAMLGEMIAARARG